MIVVTEDDKELIQKVVLRYWWPGQYRDVEAFVRTCEACQKRKPGQVDEELHPTLYSALWRKVGLDVVHMPKNLEVGNVGGVPSL